MRILGYVPARGGSKGLPGKNLKPLGGAPLVGLAVRRGLESGSLDRVWVSTDDAETARVARAFGAAADWLRPKSLARDGSALADALAYDLGRLEREQGFRPDAVMVLQTTSPFRTPATVRKAAALFKKHKGDTVISVTPSRAHPYWCYRIDARTGALKPFVRMGAPPARQKLPQAYALDGSVYLVSTQRFLKTRSFYSGRLIPLVVPAEEAVDIDTPFDWEVAAGLAERRRGSGPRPDRCYVIAEAGVNHNGDLALARRLVDAAADAGADAVKFQTFKADRLVSRQAPKADYQAAAVPDGGSQRDMIRALELDAGAHRALKQRCDERGITFLSTPFDEESADMLDALGVPLFKLPSGEITNKALLEHVARKRKPVILSTGMSDLEEVGQAVGWITAQDPPSLTLLHCVSEYPAPADQANLRAMDTLRQAFGLPVGFSDHTPGLEVATAAASRGAAVIEKHLTLDKTLPGPDHRSSLDPSEFKALVRAVRRVESALGDGVKRPAPCELSNRSVARRSVVAARPLERGHVLSASDLALKRPGTGIAPAQVKSLVGRALSRAVAEDEVLTWEALS